MALWTVIEAKFGDGVQEIYLILSFWEMDKKALGLCQKMLFKMVPLILTHSYIISKSLVDRGQ